MGRLQWHFVIVVMIDINIWHEPPAVHGLRQCQWVLDNRGGGRDGDATSRRRSRAVVLYSGWTVNDFLFMDKLGSLVGDGEGGWDTDTTASCVISTTICLPSPDDDNGNNDDNVNNDDGNDGIQLLVGIAERG